MAKPTPGFHLPAKWVFHAVGPVWQGGETHDEDELLEELLIDRRCLEPMATQRTSSEKHRVSPAISTGVPISFPPEARGAHCGLFTVKGNMLTRAEFEVVRFVCFNAETLEIYEKLLA